MMSRELFYIIFSISLSYVVKLWVASNVTFSVIALKKLRTGKNKYAIKPLFVGCQ